MLPERATIVQRRIKCFGAGESAIESMLPDLVRRGRDPLVGITAHEATITLRIAARGRDEADCLAKIAPTEATIRQCLGTIAYGVEDDEIEDAAVAAVAARGGTLASSEIGTAGRVAALLAEAGMRRLAVAEVYRGGDVLPAGALDVRAAAVAIRRERAAACGLAVGPVRPAAEGRQAVEIAVADDAGHDEPPRRVSAKVPQDPGLVADQLCGERSSADLGVADRVAGIVEQLQHRRPPVVHAAHADGRGQRPGPEQVGELVETHGPKVLSGTELVRARAASAHGKRATSRAATAAGGR
jgi:hypothetical protein